MLGAGLAHFNYNLYITICFVLLFYCQKVDPLLKRVTSMTANLQINIENTTISVEKNIYDK